jgi:hypothetical protein
MENVKPAGQYNRCWRIWRSRDLVTWRSDLAIGRSGDLSGDLVIYLAIW